MKTGQQRWETKVEDYKPGYSMTLAPLALKDKVLVGVSGGEAGIRGFIDAYDAATGQKRWRFFTIPAPGRTRQRHLGRRQLENGWRLHLGYRRL